MFGLLILTQGTVLQRRRGLDPKEPIQRGPKRKFAYRLLHVSYEAIAEAMISRGNRILDGGWTVNHSETQGELNERAQKARESHGRV